MDWDRAKGMLEEARAELRTAETVVTNLRQVVSGLEGLISAAPLSKPIMTPKPPTEPSPDSESSGAASVPGAEKTYPKPAVIVAEILRERPNYPFSFKDVWSKIVAMRMVDPSLTAGRNAYSTAARRLADKPDTNVHRDERGRFTYVPPTSTSAFPTETSGPDANTSGPEETSESNPASHDGRALVGVASVARSSVTGVAS